MPKGILGIINKISLFFFLIVVFDILFFHGKIRLLLPHTALDITWYYIIFGLPHIVASFVSLCNKQYYNYYKKDIQRGFMYSSLLIFLSIFIFGSSSIYILTILTLYHVAWQQIGLVKNSITNITLRKIWARSGVTSFILIGFSIGGETFIQIPLFYEVFQILGYFLLIFIFFIITFFIVHKEYNEQVLTTSAILIFSSLAILLGYPFIGMVMIRFVHDVSAFIIYITHDIQQIKYKNDNYIYKYTLSNSKMIWLFLPTCSILLSYLVQKKETMISLISVLLLTYMHYYLEGIIWRKGTLHRRTLS